MKLNINCDAVVAYTNKLERMHKSVLPIAVRNSLTGTAFDVKTNTMPRSADSTFIKRKPTFFKANSKVQPAKGFSVSNMKAVVGFVPKDKAVEELEQQEEGGSIDDRDFISMKGARTSKNWNKMVKADLRLSSLKKQKIIDSERVRFKGHGKKKKQKFVRAAIKAKEVFGKDAFVLGNKWGDGNRTVSRIDKISFDKSGGSINIKRTPIYTYRQGRKINVARTNFMKRASMESGLTLERRYQNEAIKQLKKHGTFKR